MTDDAAVVIGQRLFRTALAIFAAQSLDPMGYEFDNAGPILRLCDVPTILSDVERTNPIDHSGMALRDLRGSAVTVTATILPLSCEIPRTIRLESRTTMLVISVAGGMEPASFDLTGLARFGTIPFRFCEVGATALGSFRRARTGDSANGYSRNGCIRH